MDYNIIAFIQQTPGGKSYDAALVVAAALDQMIKDGLDVKETSLEFDFGGQITTKPWPPGQKLMEYIKNVSQNLVNVRYSYAQCISESSRFISFIVS